MATELEPEWFEGAATVGVTSGASVPEILVRDVLARLAELGFADVEDVDAVEEHMVFALPQELRRDLKAAGKQ
jgi:4-hydroxy-3-methylbut-2-enyl diphosphate reductase